MLHPKGLDSAALGHVRDASVSIRVNLYADFARGMSVAIAIRVQASSLKKLAEPPPVASGAFPIGKLVGFWKERTSR